MIAPEMLTTHPSTTGSRVCEFRFYEELNDFLSHERRKTTFTHAFNGTPSVKDRIESLGVPHTEVDLILVDGVSVEFSHRLRGGERVAVYPVFERFDIGPVTRLRSRPLRVTRFIADVHLGRLARYLRALGFDCAYANDFDDATIIALARAGRRIILTRDCGLLKDGRVTHGAFVYNTRPIEQLREIAERFQLHEQAQPFSRCPRCNGPVEAARREDLDAEVPPSVRTRFRRFTRCRDCRQIYWPGSHHDRMRARFAAIGIDC